MATDAIDWAAIEADPRFQVLHRRKTRFLAALMLLSVGYFSCCRCLPRGTRSSSVSVSPARSMSASSSRCRSLRWPGRWQRSTCDGPIANSTG